MVQLKRFHQEIKPSFSPLNYYFFNRRVQLFLFAYFRDFVAFWFRFFDLPSPVSSRDRFSIGSHSAGVPVASVDTAAPIIGLYVDDRSPATDPLRDSKSPKGRKFAIVAEGAFTTSASFTNTIRNSL